MSKMVGVDTDRNRLRLLYEIAARLRRLRQQPAWGNEEAPSSESWAREDVTGILLRTAEEASGIPCSASGLLHELYPAPAALPSSIVDGQQRLSTVVSALHRAAGLWGKVSTTVLRWVDRLHQRVGCLSRDGHDPTTAELAHIADAAYALSVLFLDLAQRLLTGCVKPSGHLVAVPPNESSPCGVLRLSVRRVPRAPGVSQVPDPTTFVLAA
ncbi:hypothetical protein AB0F42_15200 [Streptomyces buecherae]|uniref:hypothetical protein n=1 Tax=Streptomyces buecherae TaxID=2763006 RepID=UPI00340BF7E3